MHMICICHTLVWMSYCTMMLFSERQVQSQLVLPRAGLTLKFGCDDSTIQEPTCLKVHESQMSNTNPVWHHMLPLGGDYTPESVRNTNWSFKTCKLRYFLKTANWWLRRWFISLKKRRVWVFPKIIIFIGIIIINHPFWDITIFGNTLFRGTIRSFSGGKPCWKTAGSVTRYPGPTGWVTSSLPRWHLYLGGIRWRKTHGVLFEIFF